MLFINNKKHIKYIIYITLFLFDSSPTIWKQMSKVEGINKIRLYLLKEIK